MNVFIFWILKFEIWNSNKRLTSVKLRFLKCSVLCICTNDWSEVFGYLGHTPNNLNKTLKSQFIESFISDHCNHTQS
jgi:hypothetical protein